MAQLDPGSPGPHVGQGRLEPPTSVVSDHYRAFLIPKFVAQAWWLRRGATRSGSYHALARAM